MAKCTISKHQKDNLVMDKLLTIHPPEIMIIALKICEFDVEKSSFKVPLYTPTYTFSGTMQKDGD